VARNPSVAVVRPGDLGALLCELSGSPFPKIRYEFLLEDRYGDRYGQGAFRFFRTGQNPFLSKLPDLPVDYLRGLSDTSLERLAGVETVLLAAGPGTRRGSESLLRIIADLYAFKFDYNWPFDELRDDDDDSDDVVSPPRFLLLGPPGPGKEDFVRSIDRVAFGKPSTPRFSLADFSENGGYLGSPNYLDEKFRDRTTGTLALQRGFFEDARHRLTYEIAKYFKQTDWGGRGAKIRSSPFGILLLESDQRFGRLGPHFYWGELSFERMVVFLAADVDPGAVAAIVECGDEGFIPLVREATGGHLPDYLIRRDRTFVLDR